jgi:hypothetical protein
MMIAVVNENVRFVADLVLALMVWALVVVLWRRIP